MYQQVGRLDRKCHFTTLYVIELRALEISLSEFDFVPPKLETNVKFNEFECVSTVDTGAQLTVLCDEIFNKLLEGKVEFKPLSGFVKLALGDRIRKTALVARVKIAAMGKEVDLIAIHFPGLNTSNCLLGLDFHYQAETTISFVKNRFGISQGDALVDTKSEPELLKVNFFDGITGKEEVFGDGELPAEISEYDDESQPAKTKPQAELPNEFTKLLEEYECIFQEHGPPTDLITHKIEFTEDPAQPKLYRVAGKHVTAVTTMINEMLANEIIEPCEGPWVFPLVAAPKKDNQIRLCVDFKNLNAVTRPDKYPIPPMNDLLRDIQPGAVLSIIDLKSGFWQVPIREEDMDKTGFTAPSGFFRFKRMPFGLKNAPATFQRLMDNVKRMVPQVRCFAYLDDLIVTSTNHEQHLKDLEAIFKVFRKHNLRANRTKCRFAAEEVHYLGHIISKNGIKTDPDKAKAIRELKAPKDLSGVRRIQQSFAWFRRFIPNMSQILAPITKLTKKGVKFAWTETEQKAMNEIKELICNAPILAIPDLNGEFILTTDASNIALGAVLAQGDENAPKPIEYASRMLTNAERNYSTTEKEALAVIWALKKFRGYVESTKVTVFTDHQALRWVLTAVSPEGRLARWALALMQFDLLIKYLPGNRNVIADRLSRPDCASGVEIKIFEMTFSVTDSLEEIRKKQCDDPEVNKILTVLENPDVNSTILANYANKGYFMSRGIVWHYPLDEYEAEPQLVVPKGMVEEILKTNHDHPLAGHGGITRTIQRIRSRYFWRNMLRDIDAYVKTCLECQKYKASNQVPKNAMVPRPLTRRFETLSIDLVGPLPKSEEGYTTILVTEDPATRWVEFFPLKDATAETCAKVLTNEVFFRYGVPRVVLSDNGPQFTGSLMQCLSIAMSFDQNVTPVYHPQANPVERKNRDLKTMLAIQVCGNHRDWPNRLPAARFALNSSVCQSTGHSPAYLLLNMELRSPAHVMHDVRPIIESRNIVPELIPELLLMNETIRATLEHQSSGGKVNEPIPASLPTFKQGDLVLIKTHTLSNANDGVSAKLMPKRDGPYVIQDLAGSNSYRLVDRENKDVGLHSASDLVRYVARNEDEAMPEPSNPRKGRGRPKGSKNKRQRHN